MIKSMTAFATGTAADEDLRIDVTVRSYNSRFLDFNIHLPEACQPFEDQIKKTMGQHHSRGRIEIRLTLTDEAQDQDFFEVDTPRARGYFKALEDLRKDLGITDPVSLELVLGARQIISAAKKEVDTNLLAGVVARAAEAVARDLDLMRRQEGENLYRDLSARLDDIQDRMAQVEDLAKRIPQVYRARLEERLAVLTNDGDPIDPVRLAQEVAVLADKSDVSEEIVRIHSHVKQFREIMDEKESQGRKLNFLVQEFNREFNTIGSKSGSTELSHLVVDLKSELEKIREQVQNIE